MEMMDAELSVLIGKIMKSVIVSTEDDELVFETVDGKRYKLYHGQCCCESVTINDISGNLDDLVGSPILLAEESTSDTNPPDGEFEFIPESFTWTFYKFATNKGSVDIRWFGESNGYYSESVDFCEIEEMSI